MIRRREDDTRAAAFRLYLGYAPGGGKTRALLADGQHLLRLGRDAVIGFVDTRGRPDTAELLDGLEVLGGESIANGGPARTGLDVDAARARRPRVLLLDDIERANPAGCRHARAWQDLFELLDAGIEVHATLDVFRFESLGETVKRVSGLTVADTVPDSVLKRADEIVLVDGPPEELASTSASASPLLEPGVLRALRQIALGIVSARVDSEMRAPGKNGGTAVAWPTEKRVLCCIGPSPTSEKVVRAAAGAAGELHAPWIAAYVSAPDAVAMKEPDRERLKSHLRLAESLGAEVARLSGLSVGEELLRFARERGVTRIVVGRPARRRLRDAVKGSIVDALVERGRGMEIHVVAAERRTRFRARAARTEHGGAWGYALVPALVGAVTLAASFVRPYLPDTEIVMSYLLAIMISAYVSGRGPALAAAALSVAAYDIFFVPPIYRLTVADARHLLTFAMMFAVGLAISGLTGLLKRQGREARAGERRTASLYTLVKELAASTTEEEAAGMAARNAAGTFGGDAVVLLRDAAGNDRPAGISGPDVRLGPSETAAARLVLENGAAHEDPTARYLPIAAGDEVLGVLVLRPGAHPGMDPEERDVLETFSRQIALAVERARLGEEARAAALRARTEEMRTSLLSAVSHDLRTPLAAITGAGTALRLDVNRLPGERQTELIDTICDEAERMDRLIGNILEMVRLEAGDLAARREWVPVEEIIGPALARAEDELAGRDVTVDLPEDLPLLHVDPVLFEHLVFNLIDNAVKHTPAAAPIEVRGRTSKGWVEIEVADRGPGLAPGEEERVFDKFYRGPAARGPGMGLGLSICRSIANLHDGSLTAGNRAGGGASFRVRLPVTSPPMGGPSLQAAFPEGGGQE